jgi:hypothetical protein
VNLQYPTNFSRSGVRFDLIAQKIQSDLGDAGINVTLKPGEINTELANYRADIEGPPTEAELDKARSGTALPRSRKPVQVQGGGLSLAGVGRRANAGDHLGETAHSERVLEYYDIIGRAGTPSKKWGPAYLASVPRQQIPMRHVVNPYSGGPTIPK